MKSPLLCIFLNLVAMIRVDSHNGLYIAGFASSVANQFQKSKGSTSSTKSSVTYYDEYGSLPQLRNSYKAVSRSSQIAVLRASEDNSDPSNSTNKPADLGNRIVVAYTEPSDLHTLLCIPTGCEKFSTITPGNRESGGGQFILITGLVGDCRLVSRFAKQVALNHSMEFNVHPPTRLLADKVGSFLRDFTSGETRPLAVHVFILSPSRHGNGGSNSCVFEISCAGTVCEVYAGTAGGEDLDDGDEGEDQDSSKNNGDKNAGSNSNDSGDSGDNRENHDSSDSGDSGDSGDNSDSDGPSTMSGRTPSSTPSKETNKTNKSDKTTKRQILEELYNTGITLTEARKIVDQCVSGHGKGGEKSLDTRLFLL